MWTRYFHSKGLHFLFWSANYEKLRQEEREAELKRLELEEAGIIDAESKPAVRHRQPRQPQPEEESSEEDDNEEAETEAEEGPLSNDEGGNADADAAANTADGEEEGEEEEGEQHEEVQLTTNETAEAMTTTTTTTTAEANVEAEKKAEAEAEEDGLSEEEVEKLAKVHGIDELLEHILSYCPPKESTLPSSFFFVLCSFSDPPSSSFFVLSLFLLAQREAESRWVWWATPTWVSRRPSTCSAARRRSTCR
jgi:hypothetical protein